MSEHKSIFDHEIVEQKEKIIYLWDLIIDSWEEINSVKYLRDYLLNNPIRLKLGNSYLIFMQNYGLEKFKVNNQNVNYLNNLFSEVNLNLFEEKKSKKNLNYKDLKFLEIIYNEVLWKIEEVKKEQQGTKPSMFCSLPENINELLSLINYSFVPFQDKNLDNVEFNFQKLISNKNSEIVNIISSKDLKFLAIEYLLINNKNDLKIKTRILAELYKFVDKQSKIIETEFGRDIKNKIFSEMNNLNIRHDNNVQVIKINDKILYKFYDKSGKKFCELSKNEYIEKLDKLFQLIVMIANFLNLDMTAIN